LAVLGWQSSNFISGPSLASRMASLARCLYRLWVRGVGCILIMLISGFWLALEFVHDIVLGCLALGARSPRTATRCHAPDRILLTTRHQCRSSKLVRGLAVAWRGRPQLATGLCALSRPCSSVYPPGTTLMARSWPRVHMQGRGCHHSVVVAFSPPFDLASHRDPA
jgi:hypothetical protein